MMKYVRFASEERGGGEILKKLICGFLCDERETSVTKNIHFFLILREYERNLWIREILLGFLQNIF